MNKQERYAWIRFGVMGGALAYLCLKLFLADDSIAPEGWNETRDMLSILFYALLLVAAVVARPGKGVVADERDKAISASAAKNALVALTLVVLVSAMIIGTEGHSALLTRHPGAWFEHYLIACLAFAWWVESAACAFQHWRDRR